MTLGYLGSHVTSIFVSNDWSSCKLSLAKLISNNHAGPIASATAWEAALLKAIRLLQIDSDTPLEKNGVEKSENKVRNDFRLLYLPCIGSKITGKKW